MGRVAHSVRSATNSSSSARCTRARSSFTACELIQLSPCMCVCICVCARATQIRSKLPIDQRQGGTSIVTVQSSRFATHPGWKKIRSEHIPVSVVFDVPSAIRCPTACNARLLRSRLYGCTVAVCITRRCIDPRT